MKNTNLNNTLTACLFCFGLMAGMTACTFEDDDYFEESAALRVEHAAEKAAKLASQNAEQDETQKADCSQKSE